VSTPEALDRLLQERQADRLPSVAAAVVRKGELAWSNAVGTANYEEGREATTGTQYRIGSITKTFTATAIMQLRDEGALDLDDRLGPQLLEHGCPGEEEHALHVEDHEEERVDVVADLRLGPTLAHGVDAALVGGEFAQAGTPGSDDPGRDERHSHQAESGDQ